MKTFKAFYRVEGDLFREDKNLNVENLHETHKLFIELEASNIAKVFEALNIGWEAYDHGSLFMKEIRKWQEEHGIKHTSMSVGDVVLDVEEGKYYQCVSVGWKLLPSVWDGKEHVLHMEYPDHYNSEKYESCPACSSEELVYVNEWIQKCKKCGAEFGEIPGRVYDLLVTGWEESKDEDLQEAAQYFDYTISESGARYHGWKNSRGKVVQIG